GGVPSDGREAADAEHARVGCREGSRGEERNRGLDGIGRQRSQIVSEQRELVEPTRGCAQALAEFHEPTEADYRRHARSFYKPRRRGCHHASSLPGGITRRPARHRNSRDRTHRRCPRGLPASGAGAQIARACWRGRSSTPPLINSTPTMRSRLLRPYSGRFGASGADSLRPRDSLVRTLRPSSCSRYIATTIMPSSRAPGLNCAPRGVTSFVPSPSVSSVRDSSTLCT